MAQLTDEVKMYIVQLLACYDTPSMVAESVAGEFNITIDRSHVQKFDPTKVAGRAVARKYKDVFETTRKAFLEESIQVPIASKIFRLRSLQRIHDNYITKKNYVQAAAVIEQAAKEVGGYYTNRIKLSADSDAPFTTWLTAISGKSLPIIEEGDLIEQLPEPVKKETKKSIWQKT